MSISPVISNRLARDEGYPGSFPERNSGRNVRRRTEEATVNVLNRGRGSALHSFGLRGRAIGGGRGQTGRIPVPGVRIQQQPPQSMIDGLQRWEEAAPSAIEKKERISCRQEIVNAFMTRKSELIFTGRHLTSLPSEITQLDQLLTLHLDNNKLQTVPPFLAEMTQLKALYLSDNPLSSFPFFLLTLPSQCILYLKGETEIPDEEMFHYWKIFSQMDYQGPQVIFEDAMISHFEGGSEPIGVILQEWLDGERYSAQERKKILAAFNKEEKEELRLFLRRLKDIKECRVIAGKNRITMQLQALLEAMVADPKWKRTVLDEMNRGTARCDDRTALIWNAINVKFALYRLKTGESGSLLERAVSIVAAFRLDLLHRYGAQYLSQVESRGEHIDVAEVYLFLETSLGEALAIPLGTTQMKYAVAARVPEQQLGIIRKAVEEESSSREKIFEFLTGASIWKRPFLQSPEWQEQEATWQERMERMFALQELDPSKEAIAEANEWLGTIPLPEGCQLQPFTTAFDQWTMMGNVNQLVSAKKAAKNAFIAAKTEEWLTANYSQLQMRLTPAASVFRGDGQ